MGYSGVQCVAVKYSFVLLSTLLYSGVQCVAVSFVLLSALLYSGVQCGALQAPLGPDAAGFKELSTESQHFRQIWAIHFYGNAKLGHVHFCQKHPNLLVDVFFIVSLGALINNKNVVNQLKSKRQKST